VAYCLNYYRHTLAMLALNPNHIVDGYNIIVRMIHLPVQFALFSYRLEGDKLWTYYARFLYNYSGP
jgi:hypothetical protein